MCSTSTAINSEVMRELVEAVISRLGLDDSDECDFKNVLPLALSSRTAFESLMRLLQKANLVTIDNVNLQLIIKYYRSFKYDIAVLGSSWLVPYILENSVVALPVPSWYTLVLKEKQFPVFLEVYEINDNNVDNLEILLSDVPINGVTLFDFSPEIDQVLRRYPQIKNVNMIILEPMPLASVKNLTLTLDEYWSDQILTLSPETTHLTVEIKRRNFHHSDLGFLFPFFKQKIEFLNVLLFFRQRLHIEDFEPFMKTLLTDCFNPIMNEVLEASVKDVRLNFRCKVEVMEVFSFTADFIQKVDKMLSVADFYRVKNEDETKGAAVTEIEFATSRGENIVSTCLIKANEDCKLRNVM